MKNIYIAIALIGTLLAQGCMKIETEKLNCSPAPSTPTVLGATTYDLAPGQYFNPNIGNQQYYSGFYYYWINPLGTVIKKNEVPDIYLQVTSTAASGVYKLVYSNTSGSCHSDTARITVNVTTTTTPPNNCNMSENTFTPGTGTSTYSFATASIITNGSYSYARWENSSTEYTTVRFGLKPTTTTKNHTVLDVNDPQLLGDNESEISCVIGGISYAGISGTVKTSYVNGKYKVEFCDVILKRVSASTYLYDCKGYLLYQ